MKRIEKIIAPLASIEAQEKYIIGANKDNYYLPEELLEQAGTVLSIKNGSTIETELKKAIEKFRFQEPYSARELVYSHKSWLKIRELSIALLKELNFNLSEWEKQL